MRLAPSKEAAGNCTLADAIPRRRTNRQTYDGRPIPAGQLAALLDAAAGDGVRALAFSTPGEMASLLPFVEEASRMQFGDPAFVAELLDWIRFSRKEAERARDGLAAESMGLPSVPRWFGRVSLRLFASPASEAARQRKLVRSSSALLLFVAGANDRRHWVELGRSFERTALLATLNGIQHAHVNMPCEVAAVREKMRRALGLGAAHPLLLVRLGYAPPLPPSRRRRIEDMSGILTGQGADHGHFQAAVF